MSRHVMSDGDFKRKRKARRKTFSISKIGQKRTNNFNENVQKHATSNRKVHTDRLRGVKQTAEERQQILFFIKFSLTFMHFLLQIMHNTEGGKGLEEGQNS